MENELRADDLLLIVSSRKQTVSYNFQTDNIQNTIAKNSEFQSFIVLYPELIDAAHANQFTEMTTAPLQENLEKFKKVKDRITDLFKGGNN